MTEDVDISVYKDAIDFAFANPDVKNIAISGAYGSGKVVFWHPIRKNR